METQKMKIEVWSDVMCPFCYIGKRNFENALMQLGHHNQIELIWKSFQLDPSIENGATPDYKTYLGKRKGMNPNQVSGLLQQVKEMATKSGLEFNFEKAIVANSFDAHRLSHLALSEGKQNEVEEFLFAAHFTEGKNISDEAVLSSIAEKAGVSANKVSEMLKGKQFAKDVLNDISEAEQFGIQGVPYFVFDRKYSISGAQPIENFLQVIQKSLAEWQKENPADKTEITNGPSCDTDGECK